MLSLQRKQNNLITLIKDGRKIQASMWATSLLFRTNPSFRTFQKDVRNLPSSGWDRIKLRTWTETHRITRWISKTPNVMRTFMLTPSRRMYVDPHLELFPNRQRASAKDQ